MARVNRSGPTRRLDSHAVAAFVPLVALLPAWAASVAAFWWPVRQFVAVPYAAVAGAWLVAGLLLFWRPAQRVLLRRLIGARSPTGAERARLTSAWATVAQANRIPADRFVLAVIDSGDLNAFATGGHMLVVSSWSVENLAEDDLTGVLAHELSHHLGMHTVALTVGQWLVVPVVLLARAGYHLQNVAEAAAASVRHRSRSAEVAGNALAGILTLVSWAFLFAITVSVWIGNALGKGAEFAADTRAVEMGFGRPLLRSLRRVVAEGGGERPVTWRDGIVTAHPPARTRVARIEALLRRMARGAQR